MLVSPSNVMGAPGPLEGRGIGPFSRSCSDKKSAAWYNSILASN